MSVRCGFCYQSGHNRRSCPELKRRIRDEPNGYYARMEKEKKSYAIRNPRRCSYCKETGHNKATCDGLRKDRRRISGLIREWRGKFLTRCRDTGFGLGTLLKFRDIDQIKNSWQSERVERTIEALGKYAIVTELQPTKLDHRQLNRGIAAVTIKFPGGQTQSSQLPVEFLDLMDEHCNPNLEIVGQIDTSQVANLFNRAWHNGTDTTDHHLNI